MVIVDGGGANPTAGDIIIPASRVRSRAHTLLFVIFIVSVLPQSDAPCRKLLAKLMFKTIVVEGVDKRRRGSEKTENIKGEFSQYIINAVKMKANCYG